MGAKKAKAKKVDVRVPVATGKPRTFVARNFDARAACRELSKSDPKMGALIKGIGPFTLKPVTKASPFHRLLRSIVFQQLNGKVADIIHGRVKDLFGGRDPEPEELLAASDESLAKAGLSRAKRAALKDLALAAKEGRVPDSKAIRAMPDEEIVKLLLPIRGVGKWTVEMLLIFGLGRADVLAVDDYALKKAAMRLYKLKEMPDRKTFAALGEKWRPWRSIASWYLWRSLDPGPGNW